MPQQDSSEASITRLHLINATTVAEMVDCKEWLDDLWRGECCSRSDDICSGAQALTYVWHSYWQPACPTRVTLRTPRKCESNVALKSKTYLLIRAPEYGCMLDEMLMCRHHAWFHVRGQH